VMERVVELSSDNIPVATWQEGVLELLPPPVQPFLHIPGIGSDDQQDHMDFLAVCELLEELGRKGGAEVTLAVLDAMEASGEDRHWASAATCSHTFVPAMNL